ncbi:MAG: DUF2065 domain-containing protein [Pseudomonadota bacterium]
MEWSLDWTDLFTAIALLLVFEGILPFVHPRGVRETLDRIRDMSDGSLRTAGLLSMVAGAVLLALAR